MFYRCSSDHFISFERNLQLPLREVSPMHHSPALKRGRPHFNLIATKLSLKLLSPVKAEINPSQLRHL